MKNLRDNKTIWTRKNEEFFVYEFYATSLFLYQNGLK